MRHRAKKISRGDYLYRGFRVHDCGYYEPEHRVVWEGYDEETGWAVAHGYSKRDVLREIDYSMDGTYNI